MSKSDDQVRRDSALLHAELREWWVTKITKPAEDFCIRRRISPNHITYAAVVVSGLCFALFATGHLLSAGWLVLLTGILDYLDGRVARATNQASAIGAFLDSTVDRYQDFFIFAGLCVYFRHSPVLLTVTLLALGGSMVVSYVRAKADLVGVDLASIGSMQRPERIFLLGFGSMVGSALQVSLMPFWEPGERPPQHLLIGVLFFMAVSNNWTAVRRIRHTLRALAERGGTK